MSTDRLKIYNGALLLCGERKLASLTENREPRHLLDDVWADNGVRHCLEQGQWKFAMRTAQLTQDTDFTASYGYQYRFTKPADWVSTTGIWQDEYMTTPLLKYTDEAGYWYASLQTIYARWISDDENYGTNYAAWPDSFTEYVKAFFASKIIMKLAGAAGRREELLEPKRGVLATTRLEALNRDAQADPTKFPPEGRWVRSRRGWGNNRNDRGNTGQLIG